MLSSLSTALAAPAFSADMRKPLAHRARGVKLSDQAARHPRP
jgi:hypothetical protein